VIHMCVRRIKVGGTLRSFFFVEDNFFSLHKFQYQKNDEKESDEIIAIVQYTIQYYIYIYILVMLSKFLYCSLTEIGFFRYTCSLEACIRQAFRIRKSLLDTRLKTQWKWESIEFHLSSQRA